MQTPPSPPTMSMEELAQALTSIRAVTKERDDLRNNLAEERRAHERTSDRLQLVQVELEKAQADRDLYMRAAAKWAERVVAVALLANDAQKVVDAAIKAGIVPVEPTSFIATPEADVPVYPPAQVLGDFK